MIIKNLTYKYSDENSFQLKIDRATFDWAGHLGVYGLSGSGKTTLGKILTGVIKPHNNSLELSDQEKYVIYSAQMSENIFLGTTIEHTLKMIAQNNEKLKNISGKTDEYLGMFKMNYADIYEKQGHELSSGELRKFALSLAFSCEPDILVLDEPTIDLDLSSRIQLEKLVANYSKKMVLISHDYELLKKNCSWLWVMDRGNLIFQGNFENMESNEKLSHRIGLDIYKKMIDKRKSIYYEFIHNREG